MAPDIFRASTEGFSCFRIPAVSRTRNNTCWLSPRGEKETVRMRAIDLVPAALCRQRQDLEPLIMVWDDGGNTWVTPARWSTRDRRIHLLMTWNLGEDNIGAINAGTSTDTRRVFHSWSDDDGLTWTRPKEITSSVKDPSWGWYATGPCHGIILTKEPYRGRMVIPCDYMEVGTGRKQYSHVIYSDDKGETWHMGGKSLGGNESTVAELSDGRLVLNMRNSSPYRTVAFSPDGGAIWSPSRQDYALIDPTSQASILNHTPW